MLKREWVRKSTGNYRTYSIPGKTAALVPQFVVEDLPSSELHPRFLRSQNTLMMMMMMMTIIIKDQEVIGV